MINVGFFGESICYIILLSSSLCVLLEYVAPSALFRYGIRKNSSYESGFHLLMACLFSCNSLFSNISILIDNKNVKDPTTSLLSKQSIPSPSNCYTNLVYLANPDPIAPIDRANSRLSFSWMWSMQLAWFFPEQNVLHEFGGLE